LTTTTIVSTNSTSYQPSSSIAIPSNHTSERKTEPAKLKVSQVAAFIVGIIANIFSAGLIFFLCRHKRNEQIKTN
jgi:hypothetical protein